MPINYESNISPESKMYNTDRIFKLELIDGKKATSSTGLLDNRLFKDGEDANRLHAVMDLQTTLWSLKYEKGAVPGALAGQYTGFRQAVDHATRYFANRNVKVVEVR